jgi:hypothetical protein
MPNALNLAGKKFGRLVAIERIGTSPEGLALWRCVCDCGAEKVARSIALTQGNTRSCGCLNLERKRESAQLRRKHTPLDAAKKIQLSAYERGALGRGFEWSLTDKEFFEITSRDCHYCGAAPVECCHVARKGNGDYFANGIDRIDSTKGYTLENTVPCCSPCNHAKRNHSKAKFIARCVAVAERNKAEVTPAHWYKRGARFLRTAA